MAGTGWWKAGGSVLRERQARLFAGLVVLVYLTCELPFLPTSRWPWFCDDLSYAVLTAAAAWMLAPPRHRLMGPEERRFWWLLSVNFMIWTVEEFFEIADPSSKQWGPGGLLADLLFIPGYLCLFWAVEEQPHHRAGWTTERRLLGLERFATVSFVLAIIGYFVLLPHLLRGPIDPPLSHTYGCFAALDVLLAVRLLVRAALLGKTRWGAVYALLALTPLMWSVTDLATIASLAAGSWRVSGPFWDLIWFGAFLPIVWGARLRFAGVRFASRGTRPEEFRHPFPSSVTTYAIAAPLAHLGASLVGLVPHAAPEPYLVWCLSTTVFLGLLAVVHQQQLHQHALQLAADLDRAKAALLGAQKLEAVGRLAGGIAHDFNNLLQVVLGHCELLVGGAALTGSARESARAIQTAAARAANLTSQLLAFSRKQVLRPQVVQVNDVVVETLELLRRIIGEPIELTTRLHPQLGRVRVDPTQLQQVLVNLVINARDAMPAGGQLVIETAHAPPPEFERRDEGPVAGGRYVLLAIKDTGLGMDAATRDRAFEPFFTTKGPGKGPGLGLASVYGVVKQSGGFVFVESAPHVGTQVRVFFPCVDQPRVRFAGAER